MMETQNFTIGTFVFPYELTEYHKYVESEDIKNIKMIMKWNINSEKDLYFVSSIKFLVNDSCIFSFIYDVEENNMIFDNMETENDGCEPGMFLEDVMSIRDKLNINFGAIKIIYLEENKAMPKIEEILYVDGNEMVLHDKRFNLEENDKKYKLFTLNDKSEIKTYNKLLNKIFLTLNKKVLNKLLNNYNKELESKTNSLNETKQEELYNELLEILNKEDKKTKALKF